MRPNIELHIEELVLSGVDRRDAFRLAQAVQSQLELLLQQNGIPPALAAGGTIPELQPGGARDMGSRNPEQLGRGVAEAVYSGFKQGQP